MKKSNVIITVILAAVSIFLLALWYWLGFNEIDSPLDLVISVVWWAVIVAGIAVAAKTESPHQAGHQPADRLPLRGAQHQVRPERIRRLRPAV